MAQPDTVESSTVGKQTPAQAQDQIMKSFIERVMWLYEPEYGDFKRKIGLYLLRLEQELGSQAQKPAVRTAFSSLRDQVIFQPSGEVESTRERVLKWAFDLQQKLS